MRRVRGAVLGVLGGLGTAVFVYAGTQVVAGMAWGLGCRFLMGDCSARTFLNPKVLVPIAVVSLILSLVAGWVVARRLHRRVTNAPSSQTTHR